MSELKRNLATFQNLCVIASVDGEISDGEMTLLADTALSLNLPPSEFWAKILRAPYLDFIIPNGLEERLRELRMVILMMISDGNISDTEYKGCQVFARKMKIADEYLDEIISFYRNKQDERLKKMAIYSNLYIIAAVDGDISDDEEHFLSNAAQSLGLSEAEVAHIHHNYQNMELVVPEGEEERYYALRNIVLMMVIDGEIESSEYKQCVDYAAIIGLNKKDVDEIITEYRDKSDAYRQAPEEEVENIDIYLDIYNTFNALKIPVEQLAENMLDMFETKVFTYMPSSDDTINKTFYDFLWLLSVRAVSLDKAISDQIPQKLRQVIEVGNFQQLQSDLLDIEQQKGETAIMIHQVSLAEVIASISEYYL